ncbi:hypothetical protein SH668x_001186 [Planctomicrobium sp. SH668]|uniref:hypothetical protein n=1 Tax=Planctomicrobium sp. SH668 TaxID=3448126 RepID=UPI003F5B8F34
MSRISVRCAVAMLFCVTAVMCNASFLPMAIAAEYFGIQVVDEATGRGVPLIELETVNAIKYVTDSNGMVAFLEPGLMNRDVYFHVRGHGYDLPKDGFGFSGVKLHTTVGETATISLKRRLAAQRIYRVTGDGIYRDSVLLNREVPLQHSVINAGVLGSDSVLCTVFNGKLHWFWGDTNLPGYPLGLFQTPGATSQLPGQGGLAASVGVDLTYFTDSNGQAVNTAELPGEGPTWLGSLTVFKDDQGRERLFAAYAKIRPPLEAYERGVVEFNPETFRFEKRCVFPKGALIYPDGHSLRVTENDGEYLYFSRPFPDVRVPANPDAFLDLDQYETFSCLDATGSAVERDATGKLIYKWRKGVPMRDWKSEEQLVASNVVKREELHFQLRDALSGKMVTGHTGSIYWNAYRKRYVMIASEIGGTSMLGEVWYSESEDLLGEWAPATKVVTHQNYTFYNPLQHPELAEEGGRFIYFEGTYTDTFADGPVKTPRYDYNQIMYRLDLSDERLQPSQL